MAFVLFNIRNQPQFITKVENDINFYRGDLAVIKADGRFKTISDSDYESLVIGEKKVELVNNSVVLSNSNSSLTSFSKADFDAVKSDISKEVDDFVVNANDKLSKSEWSNMKTRINNYKTALDNFDTSTLTYPQTSNFLKYWFDNQSVEPLPYCYFPR